MELRTVQPEEVAAWLAASRVGFHSPSPSAEEAETLARLFVERNDLDRAWAAFDGERVVATFRSFATEVTVPGGAAVAADAISGVTVLPTHRRRGLLSSLMREDLAAARGRGEPLAVLVASEGPIYGRYGFGPAVDTVGVELETRGLSFAFEGAGEVSLAEPEEFVAAAFDVYEAHRRATPGAIVRPPHWWRAPAGLEPGWLGGAPGTRLALARSEDGGAVTGYARWHVDDDWAGHRPRARLVVDELFGVDLEAEARLWRLVTGVDLVSVLEARRGVEDPLRWLLRDPRAVRQTWRADWLWVRVLDVSAALSARSALAPGSVVFDVEDELGYAAGRFAWDGLSCAESGAPADLTLPAATLGACYLGGVSLRSLAAAGLAVEHRAGAVDELDGMLRSGVAPWCATMF